MDVTVSEAKNRDQVHARANPVNEKDEPAENSGFIRVHFRILDVQQNLLRNYDWAMRLGLPS